MTMNTNTNGEPAGYAGITHVWHWNVKALAETRGWTDRDLAREAGLNYAMTAAPIWRDQAQAVTVLTVQRLVVGLNGVLPVFWCWPADMHGRLTRLQALNHAAIDRVTREHLLSTQVITWNVRALAESQGLDQRELGFRSRIFSSTRSQKRQMPLDRIWDGTAQQINIETLARLADTLGPQGLQPLWRRGEPLEFPA